jgi:hypothetical protein
MEDKTKLQEKVEWLQGLLAFKNKGRFEKEQLFFGWICGFGWSREENFYPGNQLYLGADGSGLLNGTGHTVYSFKGKVVSAELLPSGGFAEYLILLELPQNTIPLFFKGQRVEIPLKNKRIVLCGLNSFAYHELSQEEVSRDEISKQQDLQKENPFWDLSDFALSIPFILIGFRIRWEGLFVSPEDYDPAVDFWWCRAIKSIREEVKRRHPHINPALSAQRYLEIWQWWATSYIEKYHPEVANPDPNLSKSEKFSALVAVLKEFLEKEAKGESFNPYELVV